MKPFKVIIKQQGCVPEVVSIVDKNDKGYGVSIRGVVKIAPFETIEYICSFSRIIYKRIKAKPAI